MFFCDGQSQFFLGGCPARAVPLSFLQKTFAVIPKWRYDLVVKVKLTKNAKKGIQKLPKKTKENAFEVLSLLENDESLTDWEY